MSPACSGPGFQFFSGVGSRLQVSCHILHPSCEIDTPATHPLISTTVFQPRFSSHSLPVQHFSYVVSSGSYAMFIKLNTLLIIVFSFCLLQTMPHPPVYLPACHTGSLLFSLTFFSINQSVELYIWVHISQ